MTNRRLPRALPVVIVAAAVVLALVLGLIGLRTFDDIQSRTFCANFENTFGLYDDASVTIRGIKIGTVSDVVPDGDHVRVTMKTDDRALPRNVGAVVVNSSILTDRRVELTDAYYEGGEEFDGSECIALEKTAVPVGVSDALESFSRLVEQITEPDENGQAPLDLMLTGASREFDGLGPTINREFRALAELMASPDSFMDQLGKVLDNSAELTDFITQEWADIKTTLQTLGPGLELIEKMLVIVKVLVGKLAAAVGPMDRLFNEHFPYLMDVLYSSVPVATLVRTRAQESQDLLMKIPGVILMLKGMIESHPGAVAAGYAPANAVVRTGSPAELCRSVNSAAPGKCDVVSSRSAALPLPQLVFSAIGGTS